MNNAWKEHLEKDFSSGFIEFCGFKVLSIEYGKFASILQVQKVHIQQDGFIHAGVIASMADHTAGYAAFTTVAAEMRILTIEFKINFFKPAKSHP